MKLNKSLGVKEPSNHSNRGLVCRPSNTRHSISLKLRQLWIERKTRDRSFIRQARSWLIGTLRVSHWINLMLSSGKLRFHSVIFLQHLNNKQSVVKNSRTVLRQPLIFTRQLPIIHPILSISVTTLMLIFASTHQWFLLERWIQLIFQMRNAILRLVYSPRLPTTIAQEWPLTIRRTLIGLRRNGTYKIKANYLDNLTTSMMGMFLKLD